MNNNEKKVWTEPMLLSQDIEATLDGGIPDVDEGVYRDDSLSPS